MSRCQTKGQLWFTMVWSPWSMWVISTRWRYTFGKLNSMTTKDSISYQESISFPWKVLISGRYVCSSRLLKALSKVRLVHLSFHNCGLNHWSLKTFDGNRKRMWWQCCTKLLLLVWKLCSNCRDKERSKISSSLIQLLYKTKEHWS